MYFDRFDICEAYYAYAMDYHTGMWSHWYSVLCRLLLMGFSPPLFFNGYESLTENGKAIYDNIEQKEEAKKGKCLCK